MNIQDTTVLITGANRGIGKATLEAFLKAGAKKVYAAVRSEDKAADLIQEHGDKVAAVVIDYAKPETIKAAAQQATDVQIVVNNAGILAPAEPLDPNALNTLQQEIDINVKGLMHIAQAFAPVLKQNGGGALVQLNSVASLKNFPPFTTYSASKAASYSITQGLREALKEQGTHVLSVHPGPINTDMADTAGFEESDPVEVVSDGIIQSLKDDQVHLFPDSMAKDFWQAYQPFAENMVEAD